MPATPSPPSEAPRFFLPPSLRERPHQAVDDLLLFAVAGVDVKVQRGGDGGVAQDGGDGLVVAFGLNAARGKTVPEGVEARLGQPELL